MIHKNGLVFGGQGSQFPGMGRNLYESSKSAREVYQLACNVTQMDVKKISFNYTAEQLQNSLNCQIATITLELAMYETFKNSNIDISSVAGFSLGEYAALVASGVITCRQALELVLLRAKAMEQQVSDNIGRMIAVINMNVEKIQRVCDAIGNDKAAIANYNSYNQIVVSVSLDHVRNFIDFIRNEKGHCIQLRVNKPYHHKMMYPSATAFQPVIKRVSFSTPQIPIYVNTTGGKLRDYKSLDVMLLNQMVSPVQWIKTVENMIADGIDTFYEIGPKVVLSDFIKQISKNQVNTVNVMNLVS